MSTRDSQVKHRRQRRSRAALRMSTEARGMSHSSRQNEGTCIITVGSTGTGKSSTIKIYTLQDVVVSGGIESETTKCSFYRNKRNPALPGWVDTVGWNDTAGKEDHLSFQELLHFINDNNITNVQAVIWTVVPNLRKDAQLQKQADFINQICPGQVWKNVIIIARAGRKPSDDCQGAVAAARQTGTRTNITCLSYTYYYEVSENSMCEVFASNPVMRSKMNLLTENEVYHLLKEKLGIITEPVQVIFNNKRCVDCGVVGDKRLLPKHCHMRRVMIHDDELERYHPGVKEKYHALGKHKIHTGNLKHVGGDDPGWAVADNIGMWVPVVNIITGIGRMATRKDMKILFECCGRIYSDSGCHTVWKCCSKEVSDPGCKERYTCCARPLATSGCERKYKCCTKKEGTEGCIARCVNCGGLWGTASNSCFVNSHNLILR